MEGPVDDEVASVADPRRFHEGRPGNGDRGEPEDTRRLGLELDTTRHKNPLQMQGVRSERGYLRRFLLAFRRSMLRACSAVSACANAVRCKNVFRALLVP